MTSGLIPSAVHADPEDPTPGSTSSPPQRLGLRGLPRQFWLLSGGTLVYLIGVEMGYPFITLYLNGVLHVSMTAVGLILGVPLLATLPMQVAGGAVCDRWGRRPLLALGISGSMTLYIGLGLAHQVWPAVVVIAWEAAFGWAQYVTASNAMVADLTPPAGRAEAFSVYRVALNTGMTIGPLVAAPLIAFDPTFRTTFVAGGLVCGVFLVLVVARFRETRPAAAKAASVRTSLRGYADVLRDRRMLVFCLVTLLPLFCFGQIWVTLPIMLSDLHGVSAELWSVALVVYGAATAVLQYPVIRGLRRAGHLTLMAASSACLALGLGVAALVPWPLTLACVLLISVGIVLFVPISATLVSALAPAALRGRYMGAWTLVYMGGYALGPLIGGWLLGALGGRAAFMVDLAAGLLGAALFLALRLSPAFAPRAAAPGAEPAPGPEDVMAGELPPEQVM